MISIEENLGASRVPSAPTNSHAAPPSKGVMGHISEKSPLRNVFPEGVLPLRAPIPQWVRIADVKRMVYLIALERLTVAQFNHLARELQLRRKAPLNGILQEMVEEGAVPVSLNHIDFVALPMALIT